LYSTFALRFPNVKPFKIKAIKTYVSYVTTFVILHNVHVQTFKKMALFKDLYTIHLKTSLLKAKPYYSILWDFQLRKPRNLEVQRINYIVKEAKAVDTPFSCCNKYIYTFLLQICTLKQRDGNLCFMFTIISMHKIIVMMMYLGVTLVWLYVTH